MAITLLARQASADRPFGLALYASTRAGELAATGWPEAVKQAFLGQQFDLREAHYARVFPAAKDWWVMEDSTRVGRLLMAEDPDGHTVVDFALLPQTHGRGIGTQLLCRLQAQASHLGVPVHLHVAADNPGAMRLYMRLGFRFVGDDDRDQLYRAMCWRPEELVAV